MAPAKSFSAWLTRPASALGFFFPVEIVQVHVAGDGFVGPLCTQEPSQEGAQVRDRGRAPPEKGLARAPGIPEYIDEKRGLCGFDGRLSRKDGYADIGADVDQHAPEDGVGDAVEALEPEELEGFQKLDLKRSFQDEILGNGACLHQRRQEKGVDPYEKARDQARKRSGPASAFPEDSSENGGRELSHCGEGDQADGNQGVEFADKTKICVSQQQDEGDAPPADGQQQAAQVATPGNPGEGHPQENGHDQVVADHGGKGDGLHDDHAGGGRHSPDIYEQGQARLVFDHGKGQHEGVGVHVPVGKMQHAPEGHGKHENVDREQIQGKEPDGLVQVFLVDVFDHRHLELPGQKDDGRHGKENVHPPVGVGAVPFPDGEQLLQVRGVFRFLDDVAEAVVYVISDEYAHCQEGGQLHDGLEC